MYVHIIFNLCDIWLQLRVIAYDNLSPALRATADVLISVGRNVNPPLFDQQQYQQTIPETFAFGRGVISVRATDRDNVWTWIMKVFDVECEYSWFCFYFITQILTCRMPLPSASLETTRTASLYPISSLSQPMAPFTYVSHWKITILISSQWVSEIKIKIFKRKRNITCSLL